MKSKLYLIIGLIIGLVISGVSAYESGRLYAGSIDVDTTNMSALGETSDVNAALTYLYGQAANVTSFSNNHMQGEVPVLNLENKGVLAILYLDPTNLKTICKESDVVSTTGTKNGCMKWYVYKEDATSYTAILDHNTTTKVTYNSNDSNSSSTNITNKLTSDTSSWKKGEGELTVRLITADEIAEIVGVSNWDSSTATTSDYFYFDTKTSTRDTTINAAGKSSYAWLFDYTFNCTSYGCNTADSSTYGYWTSTAVNLNWISPSVWYVRYYGYLDSNRGANESNTGVRPVIEIPKSIFN